MEHTTKLKICFVFKGDIFKSTAPANRVLALAEGLKIAGAETFIYGFVPFNDDRLTSRGCIGTIPYSYPNIKSNSFSLRAFISFIGLFCRFPEFIFKNKVNTIYLYGIPLLAKWIIFSYKLIFTYKVLEENNEYPLILLRKSKIKQFFGKFYIIFAYRFLDGMIVMTNTLFYYFKPLASRKTRFEIINMTVDANRFNNIPDKVLPYTDYLAYCGGFSQKKDGVLTLIQAFRIVSNAFPWVKLLIIGKGNKVESSAIKSMIQTLMMQEKIILTGLLPNEDMILYLLNAKGLVLPRPKSFQNEANFPTKLGEYLATGNPVVATRVGEIPEFLKDGENAFIAESDSVESLAAKMVELLSDYDKAKMIGAKGKRLTTYKFNHIVQSKKLYNFLFNLLDKE